MTDLRVLSREPTDALLLDLLETISDDMPVGNSTIPRIAGNDARPPYLIVHPLWSDIPVSGYGLDRHGDATWHYQVDVVAHRGDQRGWMRDRVNELMLGKNPDGTYIGSLDTVGVKIMDRERTDDEVPEPAGGVFVSHTRWALYATRDT